MRKRHTRYIRTGLWAILLLFPIQVLAGGGGGGGGLIDPSIFQDINTTVQGLIENSYGLMIALIALAIGLWAGLTQRYVAMLGALAVALAAILLPGVLVALFGAGIAPIA